jgi:hypothetical protein
MGDRAKVSEPDTEAPAAVPAAGAVRTREEAILALQRSVGNAAVGRLLARQPADVDVDVDVERLDAPKRIPSPDELQKPPAKGVPQQIDANTVLITPTFGPGLQAHGHYDWGVTYALPVKAAADGWMIQELYMEANGGAPGVHFWECWKVLANKLEPEDRGSDPYDDHYEFKNVPGAQQDPSGWKRHTGIIRFYPGPLPPELGPEEPGKSFYHTKNQPTGWTGKGTRHDAYAEWSPKHNGFVGYAGLTEVRAGDKVTFRPR